MQTIADEIINTFMPQIFYFSLKKTSNDYDAEELTQEIMFEALKTLNAGSEPQNVKAWIWKIARNRYSRWADHKAQSRKLLDMDELAECLPDTTDINDDIIKAEEVDLLHI